MEAQELRNLQEAYMDVYENQILDEELTGERLKRAETKEKSLGRRKSTLPSREALNRVSRGTEGTGTEGGRKAPVKRGGAGTAGRAKVSGTGGDDMDRGYGNKAKRRAAELNKEEVDIYDIILSHLLDEGYAETLEAAEVMMVNMSEEWRDSIMEGYKRFPYKKVEAKIHKKEADNPAGRGTPQSTNMDKVFRHFKDEVRRTERREHSPQISKAKEAENRAMNF